MSRRSAEKAIGDGRVTVNGINAQIGDSADLATDVILLDGVQVHGQDNKVYIALNKPRGYVTTMDDEKGRRTVADLLRKIPQRVYPVGRLDMYSEGLLICTNDGAFANVLMHPSKHMKKTYIAEVRGNVNPDVIDMLRQPMDIDGYRIKPAVVEAVELSDRYAVFKISISEGRNRQIRKMCEGVGLEVARLRRISIGPVKLGMLKPGTYRELTAEELRAIRNALGEDK